MTAVDAPVLADRIAAAVADALGDGWEASGSAQVLGIAVLSRGGYRLHLWVDRTGAVQVHGIRPPGTVGVDHRITVASGRGTLRVAAAIRRRLLPAYVADFERALGQLGDRVARLDVRRETADRLRPLVPGASVTPDHLYLRWKDDGIGNGRVTIADDGTVTLEVRGLDAATCAAMLDAMVGSAS